MVGLHAECIWLTIGRTTVLQGVDLHLGSPVTVLLGVNGAGKTSLLRILAGILPASRGVVSFQSDRDHADARRTYSVGYLPQSPRPVRGLKVGQYLEYFAFLKKMRSGQARREIREVLALIGLEDQAAKATLALSGGTMRRLALGAAVLGSPDVLLLDEPTAGLDPEQRIRMRSLVQEVSTRSPVLISTHLAEDTAHLADKIVILHEGRVVANHALAESTGPRHGEMAPSDVEQLFLTAIRAAG